jgi:hypothetical protein
VFSHEVALEVVPTADINVVLVDADEIEALPLAHGLAREKHREDVVSHPDQGSDRSGLKPAFFG